MYTIDRYGTGTDEQVRLEDREAGSSARIAVGYGFNCFSFACRLHGQSRELLYAGEGFPSSELPASHHGTPILAPFPNRIREGKFSWAGEDFELPRNERGVNAIHGYVIDQPWRIVDSGTSDEAGAWVRGEYRFSVDHPNPAPPWPGDFRIGYTYALKGAVLDASIDIDNPGDQAIPFGFGTHPYFRFPIDPSGQLARCEIRSPVTRTVELIDCLPTGRLGDVPSDADLASGLPFDRRTFDDVFTGVQPSADGVVRHALLDHQAGVRLDLTHDRQFEFIVIYTPPHRKAICIEPYTCVTDAINPQGAGFETGLWSLAPGEKRSLTIRYEASAI